MVTGSPVPERIGRYAVREVIGAGGFATVYRATDERLGVEVALKVLAENHSLDPDLRERFIEEGRRLRRARSAHLVTVHDLDETERAQPYLVMEWADRGDLARRVAAARSDGRSPTLEDAWTVARSVTAALHVLHDQQLVHRDLAPKNLLLSSLAVPAPLATAASAPAPAGPAQPLPRRSPGVLAADERVLLADLGVSKDLAVASGLTVAAGTSGFAPPEQRENGSTVDCRADIWAASALIVWLAIDRAPDDADRWRRDVHEAGWPPDVTRVLARGLARRPGDRHPSIDAWHAELEKALARPPSRPEPPSPPSPVRRSPRRGAVIGGAILAALLGTALGRFTADLRDDGPRVHTERVGDGDLQTVVEAHGITVELAGPTATEVGATVELTAEVRGASSWAWVGADGALVPGAPSFAMRARSAGRATVRLLAIDDQGRVVEATHRLLVA